MMMLPIQNRNILAAPFLALAVVFAWSVENAHAQSKPVHSVLELFTSQGCSSCPPADKVAGEIKDQDGVLVLSYNIDYWDYLGWQDTLANPEFSERQRDYARSRGDKQVYTPQIIVNGNSHIIGSKKNAVRRSISTQKTELHKLPVSVEVDRAPDVMTIDIGAAAGTAKLSGTVYLVVFSRKVVVSVGKGENRGRELVYHNVVRKLIPVGMWNGKKTRLSLPRYAGGKKAGDGCAVFVQVQHNDYPGPIVGAAIVATGKAGA